MKKAFLLLPVCLLTIHSCAAHAAAPVREAYLHAIDSLVDTLSVRAKVAQLIVVTADDRYGEARKAEEDHCVRDEQIGGLILMGKNTGPAVARLNSLQRLASLPLTVYTDAECGLAMRLNTYQRFPRQGSLARLPDDSLVYEMGRAVAAELAQVRVQVNLAPCIDVVLDPENNVIGARSFGADRDKVARYGGAYARGLRDGGAWPCAKHFPGHGDTRVDSHKGLPVLDLPLARLDSIELYPFRKLISEGVEMVMAGHLLVPALDSLPASISPAIITGLLRNRMGFNGIVMCDALNMKGVLDFFTGPDKGAQACLAAYKAGADVLLMPTDVSRSLDMIVGWIGSDPSRLADLDSRLRKVLEIKGKSGMLDKGYDRYIDSSSLRPAASAALIREISEAVGEIQKQ